MTRQTCIAVSLALMGCAGAAARGDPGNAAPLRLEAAGRDEVARCIRESGKPPGEIVEVRYVDETPMPALRPEEVQRGYLVFRRHWMDLAFPNSIPRREEITDKLATFAAREEYEPVAFCVRALRELKHLEVSVGELVSPGGHRLDAPEVRIVRCSPGMSPGNTDYGRGPLYEGGPIGVMNMPTYLETARPVDVAAGRTVPYWLTVHVGADAPAGTYEGRVNIAQDGGDGHALALTVEVLPITLRETSVTQGFYDFAEPYGGELGPVADVYATMRRYGINAVFVDVGLWVRDAETGTPIDFSRHLHVGEDGRVGITWEGSPLEARLEAARRAGFRKVGYHPRFGFRGGFVGEVARQHVDQATLEHETSRELEAVLGRYEGSPHYDLIEKETRNVAKKYFPILSEAYGTHYVQILRDILEEGRRRGWPEFLVTPGDERFSHHRKKHQRDGIAATLPLAVRELELMKRAGATTIMLQLSPFMRQRKWAWFGDYAREAARFVDIGMPGLRPSYTEIEGPLDEAIRKVVAGLAEWGVTSYTYNLTSYGMPDLGAARFNAGYFFETLGKGSQGEFDYVYFRPEGDPYNPLDGMYLGHEFLWFFPPDRAAGRLGGPALWLPAKREGVDDLRYLETLDALIREARANPDAPGVREAARAAAKTRDRTLASLNFDTFREKDRVSGCVSLWDRVVASPGTEPIVQGSCRFPVGWDFETYDRNRRAIADAVLELQRVLAH